ncbi:unnamed protein product [Rotaria sp. Silwood1]|nr:unnamed protein product [Rotaria sp. Silwood1]CAF1674019.1 unnamed protein product [Rotaria sp. Silwood1]
MGHGGQISTLKHFNTPFRSCFTKSDSNYDRMIIQQNSSRPKGFMVWGGISSRGKTNLRFVEPGTKINSNYYINNILQPFLRQDIPRLFPKKERI